MLVKIMAALFMSAVTIGLPSVFSTDECREQGRRNPDTGEYEIVCPSHVKCDNLTNCSRTERDYREPDGTGWVVVSCDCPEETPWPVPCDAVAHYVYYVDEHGDTVRAIEWSCSGAALCDPPTQQCKKLPYSGWTSVPFYLCDC
jgi:hypothetical protein